MNLVRHPAVKLIILLTFMLLFISGCRLAGSPGAQDKAGADLLLSESLEAMKAARSYRFTYTGSILYPDIKEEGNFTAAGEYSYPKGSHLKLRLRLGSANYHSETLYRDNTFLQSVNETWAIKPFDPDTLIQPAYKPASLLLEQIPLVSAVPFKVTDETVSGKVYRVIKLNSNPLKLKAYLQKQFDKTAALEPERRQGLQNFLKNSSVSQEYTLYIDPKTKYIEKIQFNSSVKVNLPGSRMESRLAAGYQITGFGSPVEMPAAPRVKK